MPEAKTANPSASLKAKQVLNYISNLPNQESNKVISGQFVGYSSEIPLEFNRQAAGLNKITGKWPGLIGGDYAYWGTRPDYSKYNKVFIDYWKKGGLVTISWHAQNPWNGQGSSDRTGSSSGLKEIMTPGTSAYAAWISQLDWVAKGLTQLRDAGAVVLWRPLHEMNGCWFWWGCQNQEDYIGLWHQMFDYLTYAKELDNLLWVYSPNSVDGSWIKPATFYYPGDNHVDIVGLDKYGDTLQINGYEEMAALKKPFGLTEFGPGGSCNNAPCPDGNFNYANFIAEIRDSYPEISFFLAWGDDSVPWSIVSNQGTSQLFDDPWVVTREELDY
ncbi:MAG: glycosyl hydrolase [Candidatus Shapirobacteria bacterium]